METVCPSPFDYQHNCLLYLPTDPIPLDAADYYDRLAAQIRQLAAASHGHALVLFTSYLAMSAVKERLQAAALPYPVFTMGRRRPAPLQRFGPPPAVSCWPLAQRGRGWTSPATACPCSSSRACPSPTRTL